MKYLIIAASAAAALLLAPSAQADPTDSGIGHNPGLQVNCAFNPAFRKAHKAACNDISVESVASNGGAPDPAPAPPATP